MNLFEKTFKFIIIFIATKTLPRYIVSLFPGMFTKIQLTDQVEQD